MAKADITPHNFTSLDRDKIVLSKGHAAPMLYRVLAEKGFFPAEEMASLRRFGSRLQGHPSPSLPGIDIPSGPLGIAYSAALGLALADKLDRRERFRVYAVLGDGELNEGIVWEAAMSASKFKAYNLITIVDRNRVQLDGSSDDIMPLHDLSAKWQSFGYHAISCDGHSLPELCEAVEAEG
jgi:transketolase